MFKTNKKQKKKSAVRKSSLPKKSISTTYILRVVFLMLFVGGAYVGKISYEKLQLFPVKQVLIEGEFNYLDKALIKEKIAPLAIGGFFDLDIISIRNELVSMQWVDDAFIRREWPESVIIRVVEKKPVAKWNDGGVLTANGDLFYPEKTKAMIQLVSLRGPELRHSFILTEFNKIQSLLHQAEIKITELSQNDRRSWKMNIDGVVVYLGRKNVYKKIESLVAVYRALIKPKIDKIKQIDLRYTNGFAVTWEKRIAIKMKNEMTRMKTLSQLKIKQGLLMGAIKYV